MKKASRNGSAKATWRSSTGTKRSSTSQASKRSSVNASKRSSVNQTTRRSTIKESEEQGNTVTLPSVNRVSVFSSEPRTDLLPAHFPNKEWGNANRILLEKEVNKFVKAHPQVLLNYMYDTVDVDILEDLLRQKKGVVPDKGDRQHKHRRIRTKEPVDLFTQDSTKAVSKSLIEAIQKDTSLHHLLEIFCPIFVRILHADSCNLYVQEGTDTKKYYLLKKGGLSVCNLDGTPVKEARRRKKAILVNDVSSDPRFSHKNGRREGVENDNSILCVPLILPSKEIPAIFEVFRSSAKLPYMETDIQIANMMTGWIAACVGENQEKRTLISQQYVIDFLLENTKELFDGVTETEQLVPKIMRHTKELVKADRCSLFLVDEGKDELYANYFDEGEKSSVGIPLFEKKEMIRFAKDRGIAGHVAMTGEVVNIYDAYEDPRFNKDVDKLTGYTTRNILCIPIISRNNVLGVVQMVNSMKSPYFTEADENALKMFTAYCAIALHYNNFYCSLRKQEARNSVCMEVMQYHTACHKSSCTDLVSKPYICKGQIPRSFYTFDFNAHDHLGILPELFIQMTENLCGKDRFESSKLAKFILTVRKNYRNVSYHNFPHGFHVAHCLWRMIHTAPETFSNFEKMGLIIAGICHDVDHRGFSNEFFKKLNLPLANLYSTSVMEQHHYRQTVTILQSENIFSFLSAEKYKEMLSLIRHCILATDLSLYFGFQKTLKKLLDDNNFDATDDHCRQLTISLMMTASDLCGVTKPWIMTMSSTKLLYEEFYDQGDEEKKRGFTPISMMDRSHSDEIPKQQVGFFDFVCLPLYKLLTRILPGTKDLLRGCQRNRKKWVKLVGSQKIKNVSEDDDDDEDEDEENSDWVNVFKVERSSQDHVIHERDSGSLNERLD